MTVAAGHAAGDDLERGAGVGPRAIDDFTSELTVWRADLGQIRGWVDAHEARRRGAERDEVWRRRVASRAALRLVLGRHLGRDPASLAFVAAANGKPALEPAAAGGFEFNLSRSGDLCLIAVSRIGPVGVDVEALVDFPELEGMTRSRLARVEAEEVLRHSGPERVLAFHRCWTRKEACLKACGAGLRAGVVAVAVSVGEPPRVIAAEDDDPGDWALRDVELGPGHLGAVALFRSGKELSGGAWKPMLLSVDSQPS